MRRTWMKRRNKYMRGVKGMRYEVRRRTFCNSPEKKKFSTKTQHETMINLKRP